MVSGHHGAQGIAYERQRQRKDDYAAHYSRPDGSEPPQKRRTEY